MDGTCTIFAAPAAMHQQQGSRGLWLQLVPFTSDIDVSVNFSFRRSVEESFLSFI